MNEICVLFEEGNYGNKRMLLMYNINKVGVCMCKFLYYF